MTTKSGSGEKGGSRGVFLRAASDLMIESGSVKVTLMEIAQRANLNAALIKYYFGNKDGLMLALVESIVGTSVQEMDGLIKADMTAVEKLTLHIKAVINTYFRYPFVNRLMHSMLADPANALQVSYIVSKPLADRQKQLIEQGIENGEFKPIDPLMFYFIVLGACDHLFFGRHLLKYAFDITTIDDAFKRKYTATIIEMVFNGILVK